MSKKEEDLRNLIKELIYEEKFKLKSFYIKNSSFFDSHPYDISQISRAVKKAGGKNIRTESSYGWSNQPEVVVFDASEDLVEDIAAEVSRALDTEWVHIREKDW